MTQGAPSEVVHVAESALGDAVQHANTSGPETTEFWATVLSPLAAFAVAFAFSWITAHGVDAPTWLQVAAPAGAATIVATVAAWCAKAYTQARTALKTALITHTLPPTSHP